MSLFEPSFVQVFDNAGDPLNGAKWKFYLTGTSTPTNVYSDAAITSSLGSVVTSDSAGRFVEMYLDDSLIIRAVLTTSADVTILDIDPFNARTSTIVNSIADLKALSTTSFSVVWLNDGQKSGWFRWQTGDYSANVTADTLNGIYIPSNANTSGTTGCWLRDWDGVTARPEWFGAVMGNGLVDSYNALQACLNVTGIITLGAGIYYSSRGITLPSTGAVIKGQSSLISGISVSHATDHLMSQRGVASTSYALTVDLADFALARSVTPTTPGSAADDITQGHGLHFFMATNPRVRNVYTYNNLIELYISNVLSGDFHNVRGIRQTGSSGDRWTGCYVDGVTTGGTFGGPSPNPSLTITKPNMIGMHSLGTSTCYQLEGAIADLWMVDPEAAGGHVEFYINNANTNAQDCHIIRPIADGYKTYGIHLSSVAPGSSINIVDAWVAPAASATGAGVRVESSHGVNLSGRANHDLASGVAGVNVSDSSGLDVNWRTYNCQYPFYAISMVGSTVHIKAQKDYGGAAFGDLVTIIGGQRSRIFVDGSIFSGQAYVNGINCDATAGGYLFDVSGLQVGAASSPITINAGAVTTQGDVGGHVIINPGAGAML